MTESSPTAAGGLLVEQLVVPGVLLITPSRHSDARGSFFEAYNRQAFLAAGVASEFVQDNQSSSVHSGTMRGLHFQIPPMAQAKLVRVLKGAIIDVAVDIRSGSASFGKFASAMLSAENGRQFFIPAGFAHGFCTLDPHTEVLYKVDAPYSRDHERGLLWNDPELGIPWPPLVNAAAILDRDRQWPALRSLPSYF
ncbi:MAG: dTDP-4-dehydrorhamnose 3,5-epimerase [Rhizomicrobium sp.]